MSSSLERSSLSSPNSRRLDALGITFLLALMLILALGSWRAWGDPTIDFPHELYIGWRISVGDVLYRDIEFIYGPLSQWANGLLFSVFGASYLTLVMANFAVAALVCLLAFRFIARSFGWLVGLMAAGMFVPLHMFQQMEPYSCFNFLGPYCHEATHGTLLLLLLIGLSERIPAKYWPCFCRGLIVGALLLLKPEFVFAGTVVLAAGLWLNRRDLERSVWVGLGSGVATPIVASLLYFLIKARFTPEQALASTFGALAPLWRASLQNNPLYRYAMGVDDIPTRARQMAISVLAFLVIGSLAYFLDRIRLSRWRLILGSAYLLLLAVGMNRPQVLELARGWPLLSLFGFALVVFLRRKSLLSEQASRFAILLGLAAMVLCLKIFLNPTFNMFGFYLLVPGTFFIAILGVGILPRLVSIKHPGSFVLFGSSLVVLSSIAVQGAKLSNRYYDEKRLWIGSGSDAFLAFDRPLTPGVASPLLVKEAIDRVEKLTPPGATIMAIPEGLIVNYLLRRRNPTPYWESFLAQTLFENSGGTAAIVKGIQRDFPDYIFYLHRAPEFPGSTYQMRGPSGYATAALAWIEDHYTEVNRLGPKTNEFGELLFVLLKRN